MSKSWLTPVVKKVSGVRKYSVGIAGQKTAVGKAESKVFSQQEKLDEWKKKESKYKKNRSYWEKGVQGLEAELKRREQSLSNKETTLSQMLVRETMYNQFDPLIKKWVDHYNGSLKPSTLLDPNIVKSILFQESRLGTSGEHLEKPPYSWSSSKKHPIRTKYNLGQAVDSPGPQQYLMIKEMAPSIYTKYKLDTLEKKAKWKGMSTAEYFSWNRGDFVKALQEFFRKKIASKKNLMGNTGKDLHTDYEFWIRVSVRWLFYKYFSLKKPSWSAAVKAYNGVGSAAAKYRAAVMARTGSKSTLEVGNK